jgi:hypothetical protein
LSTGSRGSDLLLARLEGRDQCIRMPMTHAVVGLEQGHQLHVFAWAGLFAIEYLPEGDRVGRSRAGEINVNIVVSAIADAVAEAIGLPATRLPISSDTVRDFLENAP